MDLDIENGLVKPFLQVCVFFFIVIFTAIYGIFTYTEYQKFQTHNKQILEQESLLVSLTADNITHDLNDVRQDLLLLSHSPALFDYLRSPSELSRTRIEQLFLDLAKFSGLYDQIRLLNSTGKEKVRIEYGNKRASVIPESQLQDKSLRYYFNESQQLLPGEIYVSPMDLNIEQEKIEVPHTPTIRFVTPVSPGENEQRDFLVINYMASHLLGRFARYTESSSGSPMLINAQGFWLYHADKAKEWGFMYDNEVTLGREYPSLWRQIQEKGKGRLINDDGAFTYETVYPFSPDPEHFDAPMPKANQLSRWVVVTHIPNEKFGFSFFNTLSTGPDTAIALLGLSVVVSSLLSFFYTNTQSANRALKQQLEEIRQAAVVFENTNQGIIVTDPLGITTAVNRAATNITGYSSGELIGSNPRILQSGQHSPEYYQEMWDQLHTCGHWQGELVNRRKNGEVFPSWENINAVKDEKGSITHYVAILADITALKEAEEHLNFLAHHDTLTELPNRLLFQGNLEQALTIAKRHNQLVALFFLDLDRFKLINDTLGHAAGDQLLKEVSLRLKRSVREEDTVSRLGGDEFTIILNELNDPEYLHTLARKIIEAVSKPMIINNREVAVSTSIGIAIFPDDALSAKDLAQAADTAMYHAKEQGRNNYQFYAPFLTDRLNERLLVENELRQALARNEFILHYQPQVEIYGGTIVGVEALIRWQHPVRGLLYPGQFISIAEESDLIEAIGEWVLHTACVQLQLWHNQNIHDTWMAVNISGRQVQKTSTMQRLQKIIEASGIRPEDLHLDLEITENLMGVVRENVESLQAFKDIGVKFAIDDFGTGYSSLSILKHLPVDALKIDRSFIKDITDNTDDRAITAAIIAMSRSMGLKVIAEGVETEEQLNCLRELGCDHVQGYLISKPLPSDQVTSLLANRQPFIQRSDIEQI
ncbi:EAL domain-containing protein [Hahella ganghwensis]|uniref:bifunctional diguanylate cyclase/phosphodiesterase n=1 Tax=Hahella ganghwensis TaxID=286420 RepID=UPI0003A53351